MRSIVLASLVMVGLSVSGARGDGLIYQLPTDGASVRYDTELTFSNNGKPRMAKGSLTLSSVGKSVVEGKDCRWIEVKSAIATDNGERVMVVKVLIPEDALGKGKTPAEHVLRGWVKRGADGAEEIKDLNGPQTRMIVGIFSGPPKTTLDLDRTPIDGKLGTLDCGGVSGDVDFVRGKDTLHLSMENWLHEQAPFGVVSAQWRFERRENGAVMGSGAWKFTLADTGAEARSEMPERN